MDFQFFVLSRIVYWLSIIRTGGRFNVERGLSRRLNEW